MEPRSDFHFNKWYLDCVEKHGNVFVGYAARMSWKSFTLDYASTLRHSGETQPSVGTSLRKNALPHIQDDTVTWASPHLKVRGTWKALCPPIERVLYKSSEGSITWSCLQPRASANLQIEESGFRGFGYVECLGASVKPWLLPLGTLRWGRYISDWHSVVWIDWKGPMRQAFVFYDGVQEDKCSITDDEITFGDGTHRLTLSERTILRRGPLLSTALSMIPGVEKMFPSSILQAQELKWRSKGSFRSSDAPSEQGWAIHEIVSFE